MRVTLIAAQSLDGFITRHDEPGTAFTSAADKAHFTSVLKSFDCSIVGGETYRVARDHIRQRLGTQRRRLVMTRRPHDYAADVVPDALEFTAEPPAALLSRLRAHGHRACALLGGARLHHLFLTHGLVDAMWITIEPRLFGGGTPFLAGTADAHLKLEAAERLPASDSLLIRYSVIK
ncbi:MAG TPA: dihydrofolate reductase family protein [Candidatus Synoicihabitans sp.]|nr:dihydrofolate reductase family protein [Candidatus Synoicihabitans sp.]